jgi:hypothetical protein
MGSSEGQLPPKFCVLTLSDVKPLKERGLVVFPGLKKALIPDKLIRLQSKEISGHKRNGRPYDLDNNGTQRQVG